MKKKLKRIFVFILCAVIIFNVDNISAFKVIFDFLGSNMVTYGKTENTDNDEIIEDNIVNDETVEAGLETDIIESESNMETESETVYESASSSDNSKETESITEESKDDSDSTFQEDINNNSETTVSIDSEKKEEVKEKETIDIAKINEKENIVSNVPTAYEDVSKVPYYIKNNVTTYLAGNTAAERAVQLSLATEYKSGEIYLIQSYNDWKILFSISQNPLYKGLEGMTFIIYQRERKYDNWELTDANVGTNRVIGSEECPFRGTIYCYATTTTIYTNKVIFPYLSSRAHVGTLDDQGVNWFILAYTANSSSSSSAAVANVSAGLATNFVLEDEVDGTPGCDIALGTDKGESKYYVKVLKGGISTSTANATAGALFADVYVSGNKTSPEDSDESVYKINVDGYGIDLSGIKDKTVTGNIAGGLFGKVSGDICINVLGYPTVMTTVYSNSSAADGCAGAFIGKVENGAKIKFSNIKSINFSTNVLSSNTSNTGAYVGGVIGYLNESVLECSGQGEILRSGSTRARYHAGGFVGYALNSSVTVTNFTLDKNTYVYEYTGGHYTAGGVIGMYDINASNIGADKLDISYIKTTNKDGNVSSNIKITTANHANCKAGGIAGVINSGDAVVNIHDINTDAVPDAASKSGRYCTWCMEV